MGTFNRRKSVSILLLAVEQGRRTEAQRIVGVVGHLDLKVEDWMRCLTGSKILGSRTSPVSTNFNVAASYKYMSHEVTANFAITKDKQTHLGEYSTASRMLQ